MYGPSYPSAVFARKNLPATICKAQAEGLAPHEGSIIKGY